MAVFGDKGPLPLQLWALPSDAPAWAMFAPPESELHRTGVAVSPEVRGELRCLWGHESPTAAWQGVVTRQYLTGAGLVIMQGLGDWGWHHAV